MSAVASHHEQRARARKLVAIIDKIDSYVRFVGLDPNVNGYAIADLLDTWGDSEWTDIAVAARQNMPHQLTREMIVDAYRRRAGRRS